MAAQTKTFRVFIVTELQRQNAHADEVGAVDALVGFGEDSPDAEQGRAFCRPVAAGT